MPHSTLCLWPWREEDNVMRRNRIFLSSALIVSILLLIATGGLWTMAADPPGAPEKGQTVELSIGGMT